MLIVLGNLIAFLVILGRASLDRQRRGLSVGHMYMKWRYMAARKDRQKIDHRGSETHVFVDGHIASSASSSCWALSSFMVMWYEVPTLSSSESLKIFVMTIVCSFTFKTSSVVTTKLVCRFIREGIELFISLRSPTSALVFCRLLHTFLVPLVMEKHEMPSLFFYEQIFVQLKWGTSCLLH